MNRYIEDEIDGLEVTSINEMNETFRLFKRAIIDTRSQLQKFIDELNGQVSVLRTTVAHHLTPEARPGARALT